MVTMSQKSSVPQAAKSVSQALMPDTSEQDMTYSIVEHSCRSEAASAIAIRAADATRAITRSARSSKQLTAAGPNNDR
jgi:hypothetical protein